VVVLVSLTFITCVVPAVQSVADVVSVSAAVLVDDDVTAETGDVTGYVTSGREVARWRGDAVVVVVVVDVRRRAPPQPLLIRLCRSTVRRG